MNKVSSKAFRAFQLPGFLPLAGGESSFTRAAVAWLNQSKMDDMKPGALDGASILVTGGTGSFGRRFVESVLAAHRPRRLVVFSRDELKQYEMGMAGLAQADHRALRYFIGDVRDFERLDMAMRDVEIVVHAAALKQVPTAEYNPFECIRTNVYGAENVVRAAIHNNVNRVIALSTDKAANPVNLYGASKLASDKIFVAGNNLSGRSGTRFSVVRYGNVVGSRGSVVPLFQRLIREGASALPVTDARMTRFFITLQQGVDFVLSCLDAMRGGEIFVPKIPSVRIVDLVRAMAPALDQRIVGIRPGEKLHEVMITEDDARSTLELTDRFVIEPAFHWWSREPYMQDHAAQPAAEGFRYASDTNPDMIDGDRLKALIGEYI
jgi:UDP-N-acetylglucosamine 4,6-dehydratase